MCDRRKILHRDIENFRRLQEVVNDPMALALVAEAIASLEEEKATLHPEEKK